MQELDTQKAIGFALHPKMEELLNILIQHFGQSEEGDETRVMVFSSYRAVVDRIVEELSKHEPLLRAARFIGQGMDKHGKKGLAQKEQHEVCATNLIELCQLKVQRVGHPKVPSWHLQHSCCHVHWGRRP